MEELTQEQQDEMLRASMSADESGINDQEEQEEEIHDEEQAQEEDEQEQPKKKSGVAKILAERNSYRRERDEANQKIAELVANGGDGTAEHIEAIVEKRMAEKFEVQEFFAKNPEAIEIKEDIASYQKEFNLPIDRAYRLYLAENNPIALQDEQTQNKQNSHIYQTAGRVPQVSQNKKNLDYSTNELDGLIKAGKIKL